MKKKLQKPRQIDWSKVDFTLPAKKLAKKLKVTLTAVYLNKNKVIPSSKQRERRKLFKRAINRITK